MAATDEIHRSINLEGYSQTQNGVSTAKHNTSSIYGSAM